ncbi:NAD(P)-dependent dehydrogenase (short-subunit alcohol dehydrogenase family) [Nocardioides aromaticivorans]|uniref:NAD(P)-dependent dehydrogenase (Short-subunit alcohol dehydrogenase family) n=1 Tax=Nocardioides aromaticivorans TaxID=200618 RepID=A0A7Y9ZKU7_9ACTN|nr:SDR family oxidoreductase [Nocardioides aromaticivorans]NYI45356.1 NAD(P)-dependent dehydrogenase (short-subunit alcohol dehydrogenase family) [Nocardioides aromaticivorans]
MPVAVVTGAGSGLGRVIAVALGEAGYDVALLGRTRDSLEGTASALGSGGSALVLPTDVADTAQVDAAFAAVVEAWGRVDLLVNNAGTFGPSGDVDELAVEDFAATLAVNVTGSFLCARAAFAQMKRQQPRGGRIINNGSISAHVPRPGSAAYTTSKHAITGLTKALALDGRAHDIAAGQVDIGNAATEMTAGIAVGARQADGSVRAEPTFDPQHVADAVVAMARLPLGVSVPAMTILATGMPYAGRG